MDKNIIKYGFYQTDLNIELIECIDAKIDPLFPQIIKGFYRLFYILEGTYEIVCNKDKFIIEKGTLVLSNKDSYFNTRRKTKTASSLNVYISESAFKEFSKYNIFNVFYKIPNATPVYPATFSQTICFNILNSIRESLYKHHNEYYIKTKLLTILSELDLYAQNIEDVFDKTNLTLALVEFVKKNYHLQITYKTLKDKFFVSDSFINKAFKKKNGRTFKEYLNHIRLIRANELMDNKYKKIELNKIAELCGFPTYSTFYREYLKKYGVSPRIVQKQNIEKWKYRN